MMRDIDKSFTSIAVLLMVWGTACGGSSQSTGGAGGAGGGTPACSLDKQTGCPAGDVCEAVVNQQPACFAPVSFAGKVYDAQSKAAIAGAHVVARDANGAAISSVAISGADGSYTLRVPAERDATGTVVQ